MKNRVAALRRSLKEFAEESGWTFIETLIVLGIILILTATVGFSAVRYLDKAKIVAAKSQIESFALALDSYKLDCGEYPTQDQGLAALYEKPSGEGTDGWTGPYIAKKVPLDPWSHDFQYRIPGPDGLPYAIVSYGADGVEGGNGKNTDITSF